MHELMLQAGVKGMSERSELIQKVTLTCELNRYTLNRLKVHVPLFCWGTSVSLSVP